MASTDPLLKPRGGDKPFTKAEHTALGIDNRRVTIVAVLEGSGSACLDTPKLKDWACVFMLHPMNIGGSDRPMWIEYLGLASDANSPCGTAGVPGGKDSKGPKVPALVQ